MLSSRRTPPHVVLLIDTAAHNPNAADLPALLVHCLSRILLYFLERCDDRMTWTYRFFSSHRPGALDDTSTAYLTFHPVTHARLKELEDAYRNRLAPAHRPARFESLKQALAQAVMDIGRVQSHVVGETPQRPKRTVEKEIDVKNYVFVWSDLARNAAQLAQFYTGTQEKGTVDPTVFIKMHDELRKYLWESCMESRISVSWIDTDTQPFASLAEQYQAEAIADGIRAMLSSFGGDCIRLDALSQDFERFGVAFSDVIDTYNIPSRIPAMKCRSLKPNTALLSRAPLSLWHGTIQTQSGHGTSQARLLDCNVFTLL